MLIVSKRIVELHLGDLSLFSEGIGSGCKFTLRLPLIHPSDLAPKEPSALTSNRVVPTPVQINPRVILPVEVAEYKVNEVDDNSSEEDETEASIRPIIRSSLRSQHNRNLGTVLVVDDSHLNLKMMCMLLKDHVVELLQAVDGAEAVDVMTSRLAVNQSVDLILMDFMMPHMTGPQATATIRSMGYNGLIIGVTGNAVTEDMNAFLASGANKVLLKPLEFGQLEVVIQGKNNHIQCPLNSYSYALWQSCVMWFSLVAYMLKGEQILVGSLLV
jgi:CheY-like chemotaxis protein